jgi:FAD/FMN-containing dehydrogenase
MTFAVMGGSQDPHPGVSSGKGIHISLKRFDEASYDNSTSTVTVGSGLSWNDVTNVLAPHAATIGGTRASSFGLGEFINKC